MRLRSLGLAALMTAAPLTAQIPNDGKILVLKQDKGIQIIRFFGPSSVKGFFEGPDFTWVKADEQNPEPAFWIGDVLVQWMHFTRKEIGCKRPLKGQELVEFYFRYETDYLKRIAGVDASQLHIERFAFTGDPTSDGRRHRFLIWTATPHGGNAKQYWIVTDHPQGLMVMSLIPRQPADENKIKVLIDSYMAGYGILTPKETAACAASMRAFERQGRHDQVPSIKRQPTDKPDTQTVALPPAPVSSQQ